MFFSVKQGRNRPKTLNREEVSNGFIHLGKLLHIKEIRSLFSNTQDFE